MAMNYSNLVGQTAVENSWIKNIAVVLGASIIIALFAPISIHLPFSPVPITTQVHVILLLSCFLGSKRAAMAVMTYIAQGLAGFPVFAGGAAGLMVLAGPTGGYLVGYSGCVCDGFLDGTYCEPHLI
jgi:biotin transport system substrate-specific component